MSIRSRQALALLYPLIRAVPWMPLAGTAGLVLGLAPAVGRPTAEAAATLMRMSALVVGAAGAFALVDPMGALPVPAPRWLRQWLRVGLVVPPAAATWLLVAVLLRADQRADQRAGLAVEAAVCALVGFAAAAYAGRYRRTVSAAVAGPIVQLGLVAASFVPTGSYSPWVVPGEDRWDVVHRWWWLALAVTVIALVDANREPWPGPTRRSPAPVGG